MEFTPFADAQVQRRSRTDRDDAGCAGAAGACRARRSRSRPSRKEASKPPVVDVTMRITEGQQYFVNRITFTGNTTTRDNVIRREMRLVEGSVFNTEALKYSVRRLNQLGYFKELEGQRQGHEGGQDARQGRTPSTSRSSSRSRTATSSPSAPACRSTEGFFGQLAFQTSNFLGRGESLTVSMTGRRSRRRTISWRSPSRSCSTATSPAASTSTSGRCSTSATTRRSRPAAT